ncbi:C-GCAxxG-C-C family (seleno)protein [Desulfonatronum parangueonense]
MSKDYFDSVADQWEDMRQEFFSEDVREAAINAAMRLCPITSQATATALDVGAGSGFVSRGLAKRNLRIIAVDQSQAMLDALQRKLPAVDCRLTHDDRLPVEDQSVDYVFANMFLHHVSDPEAVILEMARVLKPGGVMALTDLDAHEHDFLSTEHHDRWMGFKRKKVLQWLQAAGLEEARVESVGQNCCAASCRTDQAAKVSIFLAIGKKPHPMHRRPEEVAELAEEYFADGLYCAESVLLAMARSHGVQSELLPALATGFGSGLARTCGPCGALLGGVMALGMLRGRSSAQESVLDCYDPVQLLVQEFKNRFGSINCRDITGCDLSSDEGRRMFQEQGLGGRRCILVTRETAGMVQRIVLGAACPQEH